MLMPKYEVRQKVEFPIPNFKSAVGKILKVENKGEKRKETGYRIEIERPLKLKKRVVYIPESKLKLI